MNWLKKGCLWVLLFALLTGVAIWLGVWTLYDDFLARGAAAMDIRTTPAGGQVFMLEGIGPDGQRRMAATAASIGDDGVFLVDTLYRGSESAVLEKLRELGSEEIRYIVSTHAHPDHVGGNEVFRSGAQLVAHREASQQISNSIQWFSLLPAFPGHPAWAPNELIDAERRMTFNGEEVRIIPLPGAHTGGDLAVYFTTSKVLACGDIFSGPGRFSTPSDVYGGTPKTLAESLASILAWLPEDAKIIVGHGRSGGLSTRNDLQQYYELLIATLSNIRSLVASGASRATVLSGGLPATWREWADDPEELETWLSDLYTHISRE